MENNNRLYKHIKTGHYYWILNNHMVLEKTLELMVAYTRVNRLGNELDDRVWVRPASEFYDGRFKVIKLKE